MSADTVSSEERVDVIRVAPILADLIDSLNDAVRVVDDQHGVIALNRRYAEVFPQGFAAEGESDCAASPIRSSAMRAILPGCALCEVFRTGHPEHRLHVSTDENGVQRRWEGVYRPVVGAEGEVTHVVEVWRDASERSRLEQQLNHSERLASLGVLAAGVAHEVNNPLASVLAGVEALRRRLAQPQAGCSGTRLADAQRILDILDRETRRVREISDKLVLLARPESETATWVDVNAAAEDTAVLLRHQMELQGVDLVFDFQRPLPRIWGREGSTRSVCLNLMMNAVQEMPHGGRLLLRTRFIGTSVQLDIEDTGPGIPPEHMDRIWDPFFTTKPPGKGTGLGLSISQRIVTQHGGAIHVENLVPRGARFAVILPVRPPGEHDG